MQRRKNNEAVANHCIFCDSYRKEKKPIVIRKSENPRCLCRFEKSLLPVTYYSQAKAWMTGDILEFILSKLNRQMVSKSRTILLFIDNADCHPEENFQTFRFVSCHPTPPLLCSSWTWVSSIISRPTIGKYFCDVISKIDEVDRASDVVKSVNLLVAIRWVALAWSQVTADTISKCFRKAGVLDTDLDVIRRDADDNNPFLQADNLLELGDLIEKTGDDGCSSNEFACGDDDLPVCAEMDDDDNWQSVFLDELTNDQKMTCFMHVW